MTVDLKNGRKRSYPSDLPGDSIDNPIEIPDDPIRKQDQTCSAKVKVHTMPDTALARSIYNEFMTPSNTYKSPISRTDRIDRFNRYNGTPQQPTKSIYASPIKTEEHDVKDTSTAVEDSLDAMVKEMRELLLDHRKSPPLVQSRTPPARASPSIYKNSIYPYPSFDELYKKTAIPKGPIKLTQDQQNMVCTSIHSCSCFTTF
ncbi:hypothetical protein BGW37DRAFT_81851 [Umbelopsis sp. PMI_123]|nr:hypothetical protein BGW37DRAFT_81851 [Umbelopsis sp. PMI_123]